jgi:rubrerythrin
VDDEMIEVLAEVALEFVVELLGWVFDFRRKRTPAARSFKERVRRARIKRRNRVIRRWLRKGGVRRPIPDIGLVCPKCAYLLKGLREQRCPECGNPFDLVRMIDLSVDWP